MGSSIIWPRGGVFRAQRSWVESAGTWGPPGADPWPRSLRNFYLSARPRGLGPWVPPLSLTLEKSKKIIKKALCAGSPGLEQTRHWGGIAPPPGPSTDVAFMSARLHNSQKNRLRFNERFSGSINLRGRVPITNYNQLKYPILTETNSVVHTRGRRWR